MKYFIHYVSLKCDIFILCKFPILFSTVKLKLGLHSFSQSIQGSKCGFLNVGLRLYVQVLPNSQGDWKMKILNVALAGLSTFPSSQKNWKLGFLNISPGNTSKFFPINVGVEKLGFLKSICFYILSDCENSLSGTVCV